MSEKTNLKKKKIMGKSKNRKRSKILHQRKKQRETKEMSQDNKSAYAIAKIEKRLNEEFSLNVKLHHNSNPEGRKISEVLSEMIQPLIDDAKTFEEEQGIVGLGVMAWNLGVIKKNKGEKEMRKVLKSISVMLPKQIKKLLLYYSEVKCNNYSEYNEIIVDYEFTRINSHQNNLTVTYKPIT